MHMQVLHHLISLSWPISIIIIIIIAAIIITALIVIVISIRKLVSGFSI